MKKPSGFTLVELVIVITSIVILATLTIFGYSSWRLRTARTEVKNEVSNAAMALKDQVNFGNTYPATGSIASLYKVNAQVTLTYTLRADGASYCLMGQSNEVTSVKYYIDSNLGLNPTATACS